MIVSFRWVFSYTNSFLTALQYMDSNPSSHPSGKFRGVMRMTSPRDASVSSSDARKARNLFGHWPGVKEYINKSATVHQQEPLESLEKHLLPCGGSCKEMKPLLSCFAVVGERPTSSTKVCTDRTDSFQHASTHCPEAWRADNSSCKHTSRSCCAWQTAAEQTRK